MVLGKTWSSLLVQNPFIASRGSREAGLHFAATGWAGRATFPARKCDGKEGILCATRPKASGALLLPRKGEEKPQLLFPATGEAQVGRVEEDLAVPAQGAGSDAGALAVSLWTLRHGKLWGHRLLHTQHASSTPCLTPPTSNSTNQAPRIAQTLVNQCS